jgi:hypothetical protein
LPIELDFDREMGQALEKVPARKMMPLKFDHRPGAARLLENPTAEFIHKSLAAFNVSLKVSRVGLWKS